MASGIGMLRDQWSLSCERLLGRLEDLGDDESRWEPVAGCWNVRAAPTSPSGWTVDYPETAPDPPPVTTIAWRLLDTSDGNTIYWEHAFGPRGHNFWDLIPHDNAAGAIAYLGQSQAPITATLSTLDEQALDQMRPSSVSNGPRVGYSAC